MVRRDEGPVSDPPEGQTDRDARVTSHLRDVAPADEITRRRHVQAALDAFDARGIDESRRRAGRKLRSQRIVGSVAAAALVMIGLGVVASLGGSDPSTDLMRAATSPDSVIEATQAPSSIQVSTTLTDSDPHGAGSATMAASDGEFMLAEVAGTCVKVIEEELDRRGRAAGALYDSSLPVTVQETTDNTLQILTAEGLEVTVDLGTCELAEPSGDAGADSSR